MGRPELCGRCNKPKRPRHKSFKDAEGYCECGRPTKFTEVVIGKLKDAFAIDCTIAQACKYAEINPDTFYEWSKGNPKFSEEIATMRESLPIKAKENIARRIHGQPTTGDIALSKWLVERKEPTEEKLNIEHSGGISSDGNAQIHPEDARLYQEYIKKCREARHLRADQEDQQKHG